MDIFYQDLFSKNSCVLIRPTMGVVFISLTEKGFTYTGKTTQWSSSWQTEDSFNKSGKVEHDRKNIYRL